MKLQIDTDKKTITIEESINLGELYETLSVMFPNFAWKDYTIIPVKTIEHFTNPTIIPWTQPDFPWRPLTPSPTTPYTPPWSNPVIYCGGTSGPNTVTYSTGSPMITVASASAPANNGPATSTYNLILEKH